MFQHNDIARDLELKPEWKDHLAYVEKPGFSDFSNDKELLAKFSPEATKGCPYMAMMNMQSLLSLDNAVDNLNQISNNLQDMGKGL